MERKLENVGTEVGILTMVDKPDPETPEKAKRRTYTAEYKARILQEVDACTGHGEIGALLRREGLYSSLLSTWRQQRDQGQANGLRPKKRGRKKQPVNPLAKRVAELERKNRRLDEELRHAKIIIDVQKKVSGLLGMPLKESETDETE